METIQFIYGQHIAKAMRSLYFRTLRIRLTLIFEFILVTFLFILSAVEHSIMLALIAAAVILVAVLNYVTQVILNPRRMSKDINLRSPIEASFDASDFELKIADGVSKVGWSFFAKVWENKDYYFLFHNKRQYWIVPKEAFRDVEQEQVFRSIVQKHHPIRTGVIR